MPKKVLSTKEMLRRDVVKRKMDFRHEHKFRMNYMDYLMIRSRLQSVMKLDRHVGATGEYTIRSLYFDNFKDKALYEKINGVNEREKFRIRYYNKDYSFIKLEKKSKINGLCSKISAPITKEQTELIIKGNIEWMSSSKEPLILELYAKMKFQMLKPKNIVEYKREPYVFLPGNVRITLDKDIRTSIISIDLFNTDLPMVEPGEAIILLEVKYDDFLPEIIADIIQHGARREAAFSKYAICRVFG